MEWPLVVCYLLEISLNYDICFRTSIDDTGMCKGFMCAYKFNARPYVLVFQLAVFTVCSEFYCRIELMFLLSHFLQLHKFLSLLSLCCDFSLRTSLPFDSCHQVL